MTVYEQLQNKFIMEHAWEDWKDFRDELTELVNAYSAGSIGIIGAGRCNDIDVASLKYGRVSLIDISREALEAAEMRLKAETTGGNGNGMIGTTTGAQAGGTIDSKTDRGINTMLDTKVLSLTGIEETDIELFIDKIMSFLRLNSSSLSCEEYEELLNGELDKLEAKTEGIRERLTQELGRESYDVMLCNGVFSQLFSGLLLFIRSVAHSVGEDKLKCMADIAGRAEARLSSMNNRLVPQIVEALVGSAGRAVIFGSEAPEDDRVEGAFQCLTYLREAYETVERYIDWSFNPAQSVRYRMLLQTVDKTKL